MPTNKSWVVPSSLLLRTICSGMKKKCHGEKTKYETIWSNLGEMNFAITSETNMLFPVLPRELIHMPFDIAVQNGLLD